MRRFQKVLVGLLVLGLPADVVAEVSPYPDTQATGNSSVDLQKLASAQSELNQVKWERSELEKKFDRLKSLQHDLEEKHKDLKQQSDALARDYEQKSDAFNKACTGRILQGAEYVSCRAWRERVEQTERDYTARNADLVRQDNILETQNQQNQQDQLLMQVQIQKKGNWIAQVEPAILVLKSKIMDQCRELLKRAGPEELKLKCGNVQFDGANENLPPCTTAACIRARVGSWK